MSAIAVTHRRAGRRGHLLVVPAVRAVAPDARLQPHWAALVIRLAVAADATDLRHLAHIDSARPLSGQALIAEQGGSVVAALSLDDGATIADPFVASADAVAMLRLRAAQLSNRTAAA